MNAEGWYRDPYRVHEDRWYSDGTPTALVRDGAVESHEPPPPGVDPAEPLVRAEAPDATVTPDDMRRADEAEAPGAADYSDVAFDHITQFAPPQ